MNILNNFFEGFPKILPELHWCFPDCLRVKSSSPRLIDFFSQFDLKIFIFSLSRLKSTFRWWSLSKSKGWEMFSLRISGIILLILSGTTFFISIQSFFIKYNIIRVNINNTPESCKKFNFSLNFIWQRDNFTWKKCILMNNRLLLI